MGEFAHPLVPVAVTIPERLGRIHGYDLFSGIIPRSAKHEIGEKERIIHHGSTSKRWYCGRAGAQALFFGVSGTG